MTDNEIIKALENCVDFVGGGEAMCNNCPLHDCDNCSSEKLKQALDLINRQNEKIEELRKGFKADADYFANEYDSYIRTEAIKNFAERLKAEKFIHKNFGELVQVEDIDTLVEEMTVRK